MLNLDKPVFDSWKVVDQDGGTEVCKDQDDAYRKAIMLATYSRGGQIVQTGRTFTVTPPITKP